MKSARRSGGSWVGLSVSVLPMADYIPISHFYGLRRKNCRVNRLIYRGNKDFRKGVSANSRAFSALFLIRWRCLRWTAIPIMQPH
jgi:hypothetical protein